MFMQRPPLAAQRRRRAQRGFTIVELSVAVAIAGVLLVSAIALVQVVLRQARANDTVTSVPRLMTQIDKIYANAINYQGLTADVAIGFGAFDGGFTIAGDAPNRNALNKFGYPVQIQLATNADFRGPGLGGANTGYLVSYTGIPQASCADIVSSAASAGVRAILVAPEATPGTNPIVPADITIPTMTTAAGAAAGTTASGGGTVVRGPGLQGRLDVASMTSGTACGTGNGTVTIALANWK